MNALDHQLLATASDRGVCNAKVILGNYALHIHIEPHAEACVFTFDNAGSVGPFEGRDGWGFRIFQSRNLSVVSVMALHATWYREDEFLNVLELLQGSELLQRFARRISYGGSMGGFAAGAFAKALGIRQAILLNPITTHCPKLAPWETRYPLQKQDTWSEGIRCAVEGVKECEEVFVVVDNLFKLDFLHADRFRQGGISTTLLRFPGVGHGIPIHLMQIDLLKDLVVSIVENRFDRLNYARALRRRRHYARYWEWMLSEENSHLNAVRRTRLIKLKQEIFP